jgi:hypothetical protein
LKPELLDHNQEISMGSKDGGLIDKWLWNKQDTCFVLDTDQVGSLRGLALKGSISIVRMDRASE